MIFIKIYQLFLTINSKLNSLKKITRHYLFLFIKAIFPDKVYKKLKIFCENEY